MDYLKDFVIHFVGLSIGNHQFDFEVNDKFFEQFEFSELHHGKVKVVTELEKQERMMIFTFHIEGEVEVTCDRCGDEFMMPISGNEVLIVKFGLEYAEENAEMIVIPATDFKFDLAPYIYEFLHLMLPVRIIHPEDSAGNSGCNPETLKILEELTPHTSIDPRWEALSQLTKENPDKIQSNKKKK